MLLLWKVIYFSVCLGKVYPISKDKCILLNCFTLHVQIVWLYIHGICFVFIYEICRGRQLYKQRKIRVLLIVLVQVLRVIDTPTSGTIVWWCYHSCASSGRNGNNAWYILVAWVVRCSGLQSAAWTVISRLAVAVVVHAPVVPSCLTTRSCTQPCRFHRLHRFTKYAIARPVTTGFCHVRVHFECDRVRVTAQDVFVFQLVIRWYISFSIYTFNNFPV